MTTSRCISRKEEKIRDVLESTYIPCLLWSCVCFPSLPPLSYSLSSFLSLSFTLFHGLLALILLHTQIETDTQGRMIKMFREKYGWRRGEKAEAWETARRQEHKSVFCLKRSEERATTRCGELTQHRHRSAASSDRPCVAVAAPAS